MTILYSRLGESPEHREHADLGQFIEYLRATGIKGPFSKCDQYGISAPDHTGRGHIHVYWGEDVNKPVRGLSFREMRLLWHNLSLRPR